MKKPSKLKPCAAVLPEPAFESNLECPRCHAKWFNPIYHTHREIQLATMCPNPKCQQDVLATKPKWSEGGTVLPCASCGRDMRPTRVFDFPFAVHENFEWCLACNILTHLEKRYGKKVDESIAQHPAAVTLVDEAGKVVALRDRRTEAEKGEPVN